MKVFQLYVILMSIDVIFEANVWKKAPDMTETR